MVKVLGEISLDLNKVELQGWEKPKDALTVADYVTMNLGGLVPPKVEVVKKGDIYQIVCGERGWRELNKDYNYGGHHRAVAHLISGHNLRCVLLDKHRVDTRKVSFFSIRDSVLMDCVGGQEGQVREFLKRASDEVFSKFVGMYNSSLLDDVVEGCDIKNRYLEYS